MKQAGGPPPPAAHITTEGNIQNLRRFQTEEFTDEPEGHLRHVTAFARKN